MTRFVDCSSNNPLPDLAAYKAAGHTHLCRKVSEGAGYHWSQGDGLADRAHKQGLRVGHYHWLRPDSSPTAQAAYFVGLVKGHLALGDWLMCDFERTEGVADPGDAARAAQLHEFCGYVRQHVPGYPLFVYTGNWYLDGKPQCQAEARRWPIVMSDYSAVDKLPNPYGLHYVAWQFSQTARVSGFAAPVDYNRWLSEPTVKYPPTDPRWSDTVTRDEIVQLIEAKSANTDEVRAEVLNAQRAVLLGGDHGAYTQAKHPLLVKDEGHGVLDRLAALEKPAKP